MTENSEKELADARATIKELQVELDETSKGMMALTMELEEKTAVLGEKVAELQRFHDATIERELRMKELRDEIDGLKKRLGENE